MTKSTPGPWTANILPIDDGRWIISSVVEDTNVAGTAMQPFGPADPKVQEANAHLIAQAWTIPALRAALEAIAEKWAPAFTALAPAFKHMASAGEIASVNDFDQAVIQARAALALAQEETE